MRIKHVLMAALGIAIVFGMGPAAQADAVSDFYKTKKITLIVGGTPGGGYDTYARQLARFLGGYIPGKPGMLVQKMQGAASIRATN
jgi:tripartite-type tricarboxylate transporter receptor subunit TctC